jgi:dihydroflavonol-4-reductase
VKTRTAFVTGANGFIGLNIVEELLAQHWRVVAMHRPGSDISGLNRFDAERVVGDVTNVDSLRSAMPERADAVFHVAGNTSLWARCGQEQLKVNVKGTRNVIKVALERSARRLVHTSSVVAYGLHGGTVTEDTPTRGTNAPVTYVRSKALAEREVRRGIARGLKAVIMNPSNVIGPYDTSNWSRLFRLVQQRRLPGVPPGGGSFCHSRQVARAHVAAAERGRLGANYLLGGANASYVTLVTEMARLLGRETRFRALHPRLLLGYARIEEFVAPLFGREPDVTGDAVHLLSTNIYCQSRLAVAELGYEQMPLESMLKSCYEWMLESGLLPGGTVGRAG